MQANTTVATSKAFREIDKHFCLVRNFGFGFDNISSSEIISSLGEVFKLVSGS